jgi:signal transduction histidine kinase
MNWSIERWPTNWSIERKLPLFVSLLVLAVILLLLSIGFGEVRRASRMLANARLRQATTVLTDLLQRSPTQQRTALRTLATDSGTVAFLASGGRRGREQALTALRRVVRDTATNQAAEVWDTTGRLLLRTGRFAIATAALALGADSVKIGPMIQRDTTLYFHSAATVRVNNRVIGTVQQVARVVFNPETPKTLSGLAGGDVLILVGNASGEPWTDFAKILPGPPDSVRKSAVPTRYERGELKRALAAAVPGTPWMTVVEVPSRTVRAPADAYLRRMLPIAAVVLLVGALGAWLGSRQLTLPLRQVTNASEGIAAGNLQQRVTVSGEDELGRLGRSFNTMADKVADSQQRLEDKVTERTAELESFSYSVSHDLRAPLRAIHGFARILTEDHGRELSPEGQRLLGVIDQNTRRMGQLIDDLLAFSRLGRKELETRQVDMKEIARSVAEEVRRAEAERPLEITVAELPRAQGDRSLLRQVVSNLVQNAAKFTRGRDGARIEVGYQPNGDHTVYYVRDNGAGFDERYSDKLFGVFQRLHRAEEFEGNGVGLAIVKRIVQRHGGRVWAEGKPNAGATFYFTLPQTEG